MATGFVWVTVVHCAAQRQHKLAVEVPAGSTLREAVMASGLIELEPALAGQPLDLGVFSRPRSEHAAVRAGDRIEVYRPLAVDPMLARRLRAEVKRRRTGA